MKRNEEQLFLADIRDFYDHIDEDRAEYFEGCLLEIARREKEAPSKTENGKRLWALMVWAEYEELPRAIASLMFHAGIDIEELLLDLLDEQRDLDNEATEYAREVQRDYMEMQGWGR